MQCDVVDINELALNRQILSDINYVIEWLREGHEPNNYNAIDKRQCYLVNPETIEKMINQSMYQNRVKMNTVILFTMLIINLTTL